MNTILLSALLCPSLAGSFICHRTGGDFQMTVTQIDANGVAEIHYAYEGGSEYTQRASMVGIKNDMGDRSYIAQCAGDKIQYLRTDTNELFSWDFIDANGDYNEMQRKNGVDSLAIACSKK